MISIQLKRRKKAIVTSALAVGMILGFGSGVVAGPDGTGEDGGSDWRRLPERVEVTDCKGKPVGTIPNPERADSPSNIPNLPGQCSIGVEAGSADIPEE